MRGMHDTSEFSRRRRQDNGFTLLEMLAAVAVMATALVLAVPSLREFAQRNQMTTVRSAFMSSLAFARTEAARRGVAVFVAAAPGGPRGNEYAHGWDVVADRDGDGSYGPADTPAVQRHGALPDGVILHGGPQVTILPDGSQSPASAANFKVCRPVANSSGYLVTLMASGIADAAPLVVSLASDCTQ